MVIIASATEHSDQWNLDMLTSDVTTKTNAFVHIQQAIGTSNRSQTIVHRPYAIGIVYVGVMQCPVVHTYPASFYISITPHPHL